MPVDELSLKTDFRIYSVQTTSWQKRRRKSSTKTFIHATSYSCRIRHITLPLPLLGSAWVVACVVLGLTVIAFRALAPVMGYLSVCALWIGNGQPISTMEPGRHVDGAIEFAQCR